MASTAGTPKKCNLVTNVIFYPPDNKQKDLTICILEMLHNHIFNTGFNFSSFMFLFCGILRLPVILRTLSEIVTKKIGKQM